MNEVKIRITGSGSLENIAKELEAIAKEIRDGGDEIIYETKSHNYQTERTNTFLSIEELDESEKES